ncbi:MULTISPECIES: haloacid dehalogenase type II [unclassified Acidovorax]|uniref:haloacid dehalogenase type II n=1 Tax=unclassified Acidovorax TaxID=2684926 RepID=UPI001C491453|nr:MULTISPECIES: haloacid dehalogenase type II [unclassified Acidovorax]MBV7430979.1 haloacid dehalogenase type II [Acidovorax sp. sif0732]MBV7452085.1 haloacid dehalogenase type II [Acidovorax sp. sif0715]
MTTTQSTADPIASSVKVLAFDIFGTVVDWHGSIVREMQALYPAIDGDAFAIAWRSGYQPAMARVMRGEQGWTRIDALHRGILDGILPRFGLAHLAEAERQHLNHVWQRLDPWPDSVAGLTRLKTRFILTTLSNGNISLLTHMAKRAGLPWDCVLSAEVFKAYKPSPDAYLGVARVFDLRPGQVALVATHHDDLAAARACGLRTAYIERPHELGKARPKDGSPQPGNDLHATDLNDLARMLGC